MQQKVASAQMSVYFFPLRKEGRKIDTSREERESVQWPRFQFAPINNFHKGSYRIKGFLCTEKMWTSIAFLAEKLGNTNC